MRRRDTAQLKYLDGNTILYHQHADMTVAKYTCEKPQPHLNLSLQPRVRLHGKALQCSIQHRILAILVHKRRSSVLVHALSCLCTCQHSRCCCVLGSSSAVIEAGVADARGAPGNGCCCHCQRTPRLQRAHNICTHHQQRLWCISRRALQFYNGMWRSWSSSSGPNAMAAS